MVTANDWSERQTIESVTVDGHDLEVATVEAGTENDGPPVVFLHGIPTWSYLWRDVAPPLADDHHVVAVDLLGYGNSTMDDQFDRSIRAQERMLKDLLAEFETVSFVAHDIGGGVALRYASHNPEEVAQLVLSNCACYDAWPVEFINELGLPSKADREAAAFQQEFEFAFGGGLYGDPEDHAEFVTGIAEPWQSTVGRRSLVRNAVATNTNHTTEIDYERITADTLLLWGAGDAMVPLDWADQLAADITGDVEIEALERAYHWVVEDRTNAYRANLRRFLK